MKTVERVLLLLLMKLTLGHSWLDCVDTTERGCRGFTRGYVGHWDDHMTHKILGRDNNAPICRPGSQDNPEQYSVKYPRAKVRPGERIFIQYSENGHVTKDRIAPQDAPNPKTYTLHWTGKPFLGKLDDGSQLRLRGDLQDSNQLGSKLQFDDGKCAEDQTKGREGPRQCQGAYTIPVGTKPGVYQLVWWWKFDKDPVAAGEEYTSCFDVEVTDSNGNSMYMPPGADPIPSRINQNQTRYQVKQNPYRPNKLASTSYKIKEPLRPNMAATFGVNPPRRPPTFRARTPTTIQSNSTSGSQIKPTKNVQGVVSNTISPIMMNNIPGSSANQDGVVVAASDSDDDDSNEMESLSPDSSSILPSKVSSDSQPKNDSLLSKSKSNTPLTIKTDSKPSSKMTSESKPTPPKMTSENKPSPPSIKSDSKPNLPKMSSNINPSTSRIKYDVKPNTSPSQMTYNDNLNTIPSIETMDGKLTASSVQISPRNKPNSASNQMLSNSKSNSTSSKISSDDNLNSSQITAFTKPDLTTDGSTLRDKSSSSIANLQPIVKPSSPSVNRPLTNNNQPQVPVFLNTPLFPNPPNQNSDPIEFTNSNNILTSAISEKLNKEATLAQIPSPPSNENTSSENLLDAPQNTSDDLQSNSNESNQTNISSQLPENQSDVQKPLEKNTVPNESSEQDSVPEPPKEVPLLNNVLPQKQDLEAGTPIESPLTSDMPPKESTLAEGSQEAVSSLPTDAALSETTPAEVATPEESNQEPREPNTSGSSTNPESPAADSAPVVEQFDQSSGGTTPLAPVPSPDQSPDQSPVTASSPPPVVDAASAPSKSANSPIIEEFEPVLNPGTIPGPPPGLKSQSN